MSVQLPCTSQHEASVQEPYRQRDPELLNNNISTAAVFLDIEKAFDTVWQPSFLHELSKLHFSARLVKLTGSFLCNGKFRITVEDDLSMPR